MSTKEDVARFLAEHGLLAVPQQSVTVGAPTAPMAPARRYFPPQRGGGGGAAFTGVAPGTYELGGGTLTVNGKGQVMGITPGTAEGAVELMVGPSDFRGPDYGYEPPGPGVESYVTDRNIGGVGFSAFRLSPLDTASARWSYTLPSTAPPGRYRIRVTLEYTDVAPAPSFAGLLGVAVLDSADDLSVPSFLPATDIQPQSVPLPPERMSVLEWEFENAAPKPFVACVLQKPTDPPVLGLIYFYQATLSFVGSIP